MMRGNISDRVRGTLEKRVSDAKNNKIFVDDKINIDSCVRGVYCFFAVNKEEEIPFYVGKSNNIFDRMFNGHIYNYLRGVRKTDVQKNIEMYLNNKCEVHVKILREVEYKGDSFILDANRLALAEIEEIVKQQNKGYCLTEDQLSEAVKTEYEENAWNERFNIVNS